MTCLRNMCLCALLCCSVSYYCGNYLIPLITVFIFFLTVQSIFEFCSMIVYSNLVNIFNSFPTHSLISTLAKACLNLERQPRLQDKTKA